MLFKASFKSFWSHPVYQSVYFSKLNPRFFNVTGQFCNYYTTSCSAPQKTNLARDIKGIFIVILINIRGNPTAIFIFYNSYKSQITDYKIHLGKSYYKEFSYFVINAIKNTKFNDENSINILAPKHYINNLLINNWKILLGVTLNPYLCKSSKLPSVIDDIKKDIKSISSIDKEKFDHAIKNFNSKNYNGFSSILSSDKTIEKRIYLSRAAGISEEKVGGAVIVDSQGESKCNSSNSSILPIVQYLNVETINTTIILENRGKSGVYLWKNLINGKSYVGSSVNLYRRFKSYFNINYLTTSSAKTMLINKALAKYGYSNFNLYILEYCKKLDVLVREQYFINIIQPEYNILKTAGSVLGFKHKLETRLKISAIKKGLKHTEDTKAKISKNTYVRTEEIKEKLISYKHTSEALAKIKAASLGRKFSE